MTVLPNLVLNNGVEIPQLGFGVFRIPPEDTQRSVEAALAAGYRHIDTAASYGNEIPVGKAVAATGLAREELFLTTKMQIPGQEMPAKAFEQSRLALGVDYVDLYLIHWPAPARNLFVSAWKALERVHNAGQARAIGVSNFLPHHLDILLSAAEVAPAVNQIELHPTLQQRDAEAKSRAHGIAIEAYSPLGQGADLSSPVIHDLARRHNATAAQIILAWHLHRGNIVIPKTVHPHRLVENLQAIEIVLSPTELKIIDGMEANNRLASHPDRKS